MDSTGTPFMDGFFYCAFLLSGEQQPEEGIDSDFSSLFSSLTSSIVTPQQQFLLPPNNRLRNPSFFSSVILLPSYEDEIMIISYTCKLFLSHTKKSPVFLIGLEFFKKSH